ncbi:polymer-forming cytoskeletal protein [Shewanella sp. 1_MG-2023]|uniref:polymer-forming cytoskeletal protein n=1 Tax=unclassified Shewanella TaxID=196818 RepID=UPI0026E32368|nr:MULTISPECIES: polymer-forming cytoskeletal protein [unclassified Shewanella]MDO6611438.1 polymer-forming cytoskeletal protein [Shewanella sp. 7_MG-2023]MDO6771293.1 polymer-forming cytoskeletal protein [Shewanella sp. 2_MG-2023]MDO6796761.1 polymer-forming cytoskeletal protein [Shewanella sp. 1_MG-2023]
MNNKGNGVTFIGPETSLDGEMTVKGPALIAGQVKGVIRSTDQVKIEVGGEIDGELYCQELRVCGVFKGSLHCNSLVIVSSGVVEGDVSSHKMEIYDGGQFLGARTKGPEQGVLPELAADEQPVASYNAPFIEEPAYASPKAEAPIAEAPIAQAAKVSNVNVMAEPITNVAVDAPQVKTEIKPEVKPEPISDIRDNLQADIQTNEPVLKAEPKAAAPQEQRTAATSAPVQSNDTEAASKPKSKLEIKPQPNPQAQLAAKAAAEKAQEKKSGSTKFVVAGVVLAAAVGAVVMKPELAEDLMAQFNQPASQNEASVPAVKDVVVEEVVEAEDVSELNNVVDAETALAQLDEAAQSEATLEFEAGLEEVADDQEALLADLGTSLEADIAAEADEVIVAAEEATETDAVDKTQVDSLLADLLAEERTESVEAVDTVEDTSTGNL